MKLKSLLIGSAAVMAVSTGGAKAADAIVMAAPEPMEYVRVCDVYGTGFFYIPGTETCMKIGGYYRMQVDYHEATSETVTAPYLRVNDGNGDPILADSQGITRTYTNPAGYTVSARFAPSVDVMSETELGTLRGYAQIYFTYGWTPGATPITAGTLAVGSDPAGIAFPDAVLGGSYGISVGADNIFIELQQAAGVFRIGLSDAPYARFLGFGNGGGPYGGTYGYRNAFEISYTFNGSNGFSAILALSEDDDSDWAPDVEGGINFAQGWGSIGAIAGYDSSEGTWGAKAVTRWAAANGSFSGGLHVFYSSGTGSFAIADPGGATGTFAPWSVMAHAKGQFTASTAAFASAQWFSNTGGFELIGGLDMRPATNFRIRPEVRYRTTNSSWAAAVRLEREIP